MNTRIKLTDTQREVIKLATYRPDGNIEPLPPGLRGGARKKVIDGLLVRDLIIKFQYSNNVGYCLTDAAYAAVGRKRKTPAAATSVPELQGDCTPERQSALKTDAEGQTRTRENSKQAAVIQMLRRSEGATIQQIMESTGWLAHTVRGTFAGAFKKRLGLDITSTKDIGADRVYRI